jgi:hypothetical protein
VLAFSCRPPPGYAIGHVMVVSIFSHARSWTLGRRPWEVDYARVSAESGVDVVLFPFFGHVDGEERAGDPGVGGGSTKTAPRSFFWRPGPGDIGIPSMV